MGENTIHKRIEWIDFAKGICILLMIFGHTYSFGTPVRNFIFSFHMPLFLILSGYTFHYEKLSCRSFFQKERKDFLQLIVPVIIVHLLIILHGIPVDHYNGIIHDELYALAYASGYTPDRPSLGACWFLVSLFWARLIIRLFNQVVDPDRTVYLCTLCGIFAVFWGPRKQLLQNFDVTMMTIFFMAAGSLWKSHHELIRKHQNQFSWLPHLSGSFACPEASLLKWPPAAILMGLYVFLKQSAARLPYAVSVMRSAPAKRSRNHFSGLANILCFCCAFIALTVSGSSYGSCPVQDPFRHPSFVQLLI